MQLQEEDINNILVNEIGNIGVLGPYHPDSRGALGGRFAARLLPTKNYQKTIQTKLSSDELANKLSPYFDNQQPTPLENNLLSFKKVTGSGFFNMNPTVLVAIIEANTIHIAAYAKEGLIKQHSARKAVEAFANNFDVALTP